MPEQVLVWDFDGAVTDATKEGAPFVRAYLNDLRLMLRRKANPADLDETLLAAEAMVIANPNERGWRYDGKITASAVDPYLRMMAVADVVFDHFGVFLQRSDREMFLDYLYGKNYPLSGIAFRKDAAKVLDELCADDRFVVYIVTNSDTETVRKKLAVLGKGNDNLTKLCDRVVGDARKFKLGTHPAHIPERMKLHGLRQRGYLRRPEYYRVLNELRLQHSNSWKEMTVIGDNFWLDLAMPFALGTRVVLMADQFTPQYERNFFADNPNRTKIVTSLNDVLKFVRG